MINKKVQDALNSQVNAELFSAYLYLSMAAYFKNKNLSGFANWMTVQAGEEFFHAKKFYDFIIERGGKVILAAIDAPKTEWASSEEVFAEVCAHEAKVTSLINNLVSISIDEKDYATHNFLQWFVNEQVEEESSAAEVHGHVKLVGNSGEGIILLDRELAQRVFNAQLFLGPQAQA